MSGAYAEEYTRLRRRLEGTAKAMLEVSRRDLEAARLLYEGGFYPHTVFMAEQCAEKAVKALIILNELSRGADFAKAVGRLSSLDEELRRRIGHSAVRFLKMAYEGYRHVVTDLSRTVERSGLSVEEFKSGYPMLSSFIVSDKHAEEAVDWGSIEEQMFSLAMNEEGLEEYLREVEAVYSSVNEIASRRPEEFKEVLYANKDSLVSLLKELQNLMERVQGREGREIRETGFVEAFSKLLEDNWQVIWLAMTFLLKTLSAYIIIIELFKLLSPHVSRSRYPEKDFDPLKFYTKELPLVKHLDKVLTLLGKALEDVTNMMKAG